MDFQLSGAVLEYAVLIFVRLLAVLATGPVFGHRAVAAPVKVGLAMGLTYLLMLPMARSIVPFPDNLTFLMALGAEVLIGVVTGFASMLVFYALEMAGEIVNSEMGFGFATSISPVLPNTGGVVQQFYALLAILIFLAINGHHALLLALPRTFEAAPPGSFVMNGLVADQLIRLSSAIFLSAVQIALPVLAALLLTDVALALMSRAMPQMNVFALGMPLKVGVGLVALIMTWPLVSPVVQRMLAQVAGNMFLMVR